MGNERKQVKIGSPEENQMIALVKKAVSFRIDETYPNKKMCAEAAIENFKDNSGIDPLEFTTVDCVAHHIGTLEKYYETGKKPSSDKNRSIQTVMFEKVYPETYGKLSVKVPSQIAVEDVCELEQNEIPEEPTHTEQNNITELKFGIDNHESELSAKDKKELAMYAIDQHYFFLKQLTGVI